MSDAFESIKARLEQAIGHARGEKVGAKVHQVKIPAVDVAKVRAKTGLSQAKFAGSVGDRVSTLQNWEQHRREPQGPGARAHAMIDREPEIVRKTLSA